MVCRVGCDDATFASDGLGHAQGNVVGFGSGAGQDCRVQTGPHRGSEPFDIVEDTVVQIPSVVC